MLFDSIICRLLGLLRQAQHKPLEDLRFFKANYLSFNYSHDFFACLLR